MLKNYFKTAVRNLLRQKGFSFLNVLGLAIGMAVSLLILLYVQDELSYRYRLLPGGFTEKLQLHPWS